jgi:hypothetical protein
MTVQCDGAGNAAELAAWLASNGGATATDSVAVSITRLAFTMLSDDCGEAGSTASNLLQQSILVPNRYRSCSLYYRGYNRSCICICLEPTDLTEECVGTGVDAQIQS